MFSLIVSLPPNPLVRPEALFYANINNTLQRRLFNLQRPEEIDSGKAGHTSLGIRTLSDEASGINEMSVTK